MQSLWHFHREQLIILRFLLTIRAQAEQTRKEHEQVRRSWRLALHMQQVSPVATDLSSCRVLCIKRHAEGYDCCAWKLAKFQLTHVQFFLQTDLAVLGC